MVAPQLVDVAPVRALVFEHAARGQHHSELAHLAGLHRNTVAKIAYVNHPRQISVHTERKIMAVPLPPTAVGAQRRLRALQRLGHTQAAIAAAAGVSDKTLQKIAQCGNTTGRPKTALAEVYERWSMVRGPSRDVAERARRLAWRPPLAWELTDIDDPAAKPEGALSHRTFRAPSPDFVDEVAVELALSGRRTPRPLTLAEAAIVVDTVLARGGSHTMACTLSRRNPRWIIEHVQRKNRRDEREAS